MPDSNQGSRVNRRQFAKALGIGATVGLAGCTGKPPETSTQTETSGGSGGGGTQSVIAGVNPLSGPAAFGGKIIKKGIELRLNEFAENGGINGNVPKQVHKDSKCSSQTGNSVTKSLISQHPGLSAWLGGYCSSAALSTMELTREEKILQVVTAFAPQFTERGHPYAFRVAPGSIGVVPPAVDYALNELKAKRVAILGINNPWGKAQTEMWRDLVKESSQAKVVSFNQVPLSQQDYSNEINEIRSKDPDVIYALGYHGQTKQMLQQIEDYGMTVGEDVDVFIASIAGEILNKVAGPDVLENVYSPLYFHGPTFADFPDAAPDNVVSFVEKWRDTYDDPAIRESATGYALGETAVQAMKRAGTTTDVPKMAKALKSMDGTFDTPLGPIEFKDNGQALMKVFIGQYDDNLELHKRTEPVSPKDT